MDIPAIHTDVPSLEGQAADEWNIFPCGFTLAALRCRAREISRSISLVVPLKKSMSVKPIWLLGPRGLFKLQGTVRVIQLDEGKIAERRTDACRRNQDLRCLLFRHSPYYKIIASSTSSGRSQQNHNTGRNIQRRSKLSHTQSPEHAPEPRPAACHRRGTSFAAVRGREPAGHCLCALTFAMTRTSKQAERLRSVAVDCGVRLHGLFEPNSASWTRRHIYPFIETPRKEKLMKFQLPRRMTAVRAFEVCLDSPLRPQQ